MKAFIRITDVRKNPKVKRRHQDSPQGPELHHCPAHSCSGCFCSQHCREFLQAVPVRLVPIHCCCLTDVTWEKPLTSGQFIASSKTDTFTAIQDPFFVRTRMCCSKCCTQHLGMMPLTRGTGASRKMNYYTWYSLCQLKGKMQTLSQLTARYCCFYNAQDPARFLEQRHDQTVLLKQMSDSLIHQNGGSDGVWDDAAPAVG